MAASIPDTWSVNDVGAAGPGVLSLVQNALPIFMFVVGRVDRGIAIYQSTDGGHSFFTANPYYVDVQTIGGLSAGDRVAVDFDPTTGLTWIAWSSTNFDNLPQGQIVVAGTKDCSNWSNISTIAATTNNSPQSSLHAPALVVGNTGRRGRTSYKLHIAWLGRDGQLYSGNSTDNGQTWNIAPANQAALTSPAMCLWYGMLRLLWVAPDNSLNIADSLEGIGWENNIRIDQTSAASPAITGAGENGLCISWTGVGNNRVNVLCAGPLGWNEPVTTYTDTSELGPSGPPFAPAGVSLATAGSGVPDVPEDAVFASWLPLGGLAVGRVF